MPEDPLVFQERVSILVHKTFPNFGLLEIQRI